MAAEELIVVKFRLLDGSYIGPTKYSSNTTVAFLKEKIVSLWPHERGNGPKTMSDVELIHAAKILENNKTLAELWSLVSDITGGVVVMYVVIRPPMADKSNEPGKKVTTYIEEKWFKSTRCGTLTSGDRLRVVDLGSDIIEELLFVHNPVIKVRISLCRIMSFLVKPLPDYG